MLNTEHCQEYLDEVRLHADRLEMRDRLEKELTYLANYSCSEEEPDRTRCDLYKDFAPLSFYFVMHVKDKKTGVYKPWFNGGCIFHGPHDGGGSGSSPTFSVCLEPTHGWSIHT